MKFPILARVRWRPVQWIIPFLLVVFLVNDIRSTYGAPQTQSRFSGPQRQQNPSFNQAGHFRVIPDSDDLDDLEDIIFSNARQRGSSIRNAQTSGSSTSFGVPLSATHTGVRQETMEAARAHFGVPISAAAPGHSQQTQRTSSASFGVPLSASRSPVQETSHVGNSQFGVPLSSTRSGSRHAETSQAANAHFGVPLRSAHPGRRQETSQPANVHFGVPLSATHPSNSQVTPQLTNSHIDVAARTRSHFTPASHKSRLNSGRFIITDDNDNLSFEDINSSLEILSLGRRFHPEGIPKRSDATFSNAPPSSVRTVISNPFIFTPDAASAVSDSSIEDDDDDAFIVLSPMIKAYNPSEHNERLSLSNDFLNQYNYVDVQGTTHWGYKTDDQYQEHQVHDSGTMQGKFGWTSPEGSEVKIKYIADEGGYRVISSSGVYTREDDEVLRLKKLHLAEHEKARINHQNIKDERRKGSVGIPLPTHFGNTQSSDPSSGQGGFVVIPDDDDFPLVPSRASGTPSGSNVGVPLPTFDNANLQPELDVGVFIDSTAAGVPLPPSTQDGNLGFGVPLPDPTTNLAAETPSKGSSHGFGVPLSDPSVNQIGVPLPDPTFSNDLLKPTAPSSHGVPLPDPTITHTDTHTVQSASPEFGVPLPDHTQTFGTGQQSPSVDQGAGVPLPDPTLAIDQGAGVPLPDPTQMFGIDQQSTAVDQGTGVPLSDPTLAIDQGAGVPLPDPTITHIDKHAVHTPNPEFGVSLPDPTQTLGFDHQSPSNNQGAGVPHPDPTLSFETSQPAMQPADQGAGVSLTDPTFSSGFGETSMLPSGHGVGVPLPDPTFGLEDPSRSTATHGTGADHGVGATIPDFTFSGNQGNGVPLPDSTPIGFGEASISPTNEGFGVPLSDPSLSFESGHPSTAPVDPTSSMPSSFPADQGFVDIHSTVSDKEVGVPIAGSANVIETGKPSTTASHPTETISPNQEFGIPLFNPMDLFGLNNVSPNDQGLQSQSGGSSLSDSSSHPADTASPTQEFGIPLITPNDIFGSIPVSPSDQLMTSHTAESTPLGNNEQLGSSDPAASGTQFDHHPSSFGIPLFSSDAQPPTFSQTSSTSTQFENNQNSFGIPLFQDVMTQTSSVGTNAPSTVEMNDISNFGSFDQNTLNSISPDVPTKDPTSKTPTPLLIDRSNTQQVPTHHSGIQEQFGVPLDFNPSINPAEIQPGQNGGNFFLFPEFSGVPLGTGVPLGEGIPNTLQTADELTTQVGQQFGGQNNVGVPLSTTSFTGGDLLQGPPLEELDPSLVKDNSALSSQGLDPCLNSKIHPTLLPPECATRKTETVEPSQNIGKSLLSSSSKSEPSQDSFIVVVNSDIFH